MGNRYHVKKSILKIGTTTYEMATGPHAKSQSREKCEVTSLADAIKQFIPGALKEDKEFTVSIYDDGEHRPSVDDAPAKVEFEVAISRGQGSTDDKAANFAYEKAIITDVSSPNHDATGDRKATLDVTICPDGTQPTQSGGGTGGSGAGGSGNPT